MILMKGKGIKRREVRRALGSSASSTQPELRTTLSLPRSYSCATMLRPSLLRKLLPRRSVRQDGRTHPCQPSPRQLPLGAQTLPLACDEPAMPTMPAAIGLTPDGLMLMPLVVQPADDGPAKSLLAHDCWRGKLGIGGELSWDRLWVLDARIGTGEGCDIRPGGLRPESEARARVSLVKERL